MNLESIETETAGRLAVRHISPARWVFFEKLFKYLSIIGLSALSYLVISHFLLMSVQVVGASMMPTLHDSQRLLLNRWIYLVHSPRLGDIVVFRDHDGNTLAVKRVIGIPGDTILFRNGEVYRNGKILREAYLSSGTPTFPCMGLKEQSLRCTKDHFVLLGDNRLNSADSRTYGAVSRDDILGQIVR